MNRRTWIRAASLALWAQLLVAVSVTAQEQNLLCSADDREQAEKMITVFADKSHAPTSELVAAIGKNFMGTPYQGQTLENGKEEKLVINLREMDCTTFAENCLALSRTIRSGDAGFERFAHELEKIRYRDGKRAGYLSRLHYFSDWIADNQRKGLVSQPAAIFGANYPVKVFFMSTHPQSYPVLKENPELVPELAQLEKAISKTTHFYVKKEDLPAVEDKLAEGDIIGLTTSIPGLDVTHVGILVKKDGKLHLLHASSSLKKVAISQEPLTELMTKSKSWTGIMIARPL